LRRTEMSTDDIIQKAIKQFLQELENSEAEYEKVSHNEHVSIYRKLDNTIGIYRIKVVGTIPHPVDIVDKVLFDNELRVLWDTIFETMQEVDTLDNGSSVIYIAAKKSTWYQQQRYDSHQNAKRTSFKSRVSK